MSTVNTYPLIMFQSDYFYRNLPAFSLSEQFQRIFFQDYLLWTCRIKCYHFLDVRYLLFSDKQLPILWNNDCIETVTNTAVMIIMHQISKLSNLFHQHIPTNIRNTTKTPKQHRQPVRRALPERSRFTDTRIVHKGVRVQLLCPLFQNDTTMGPMIHQPLTFVRGFRVTLSLVVSE